jgi:hypothetical protein
MGYYNKNYYPKTEIVKSEATDIPQIFSRLDGINTLSDFDRNALADLKSYYAKKTYISVRQYEFLKKINDRYNDEKLQTIDNWRQSFTNEMREKLKIVCEYYAETGYFSNVVREFEKDRANYVPTPEQYEKITENAYAKRLIESQTSAPEFGLGDLIYLRANARSSSIYPASHNSYVNTSALAGKPLFVVNNAVNRKGEIHRYCQVFPITNPEQQVLIREKDLKKSKGK